MKYITTKLIALLAAALLLLTAVPLGSAAGADHPEKQQFTIQKADRLMAAEGMDAREWEKRMAEQKAAGLRNPVTEESLRAANAGVKLHRQNGRIYMIEGADALGTVHGPLDACRAAYSMLGLLSGSSGADLRLWSRLNIGSQLSLYVFQQVYEGLTVVASTLKIAVNSEGMVTAVFSSLSSGHPESADARDITAEEAEEAVRKYLADLGQEDSVLTSCTTRAVVALELSKEEAEERANEVLPDQQVWIVYSRNPAFADRGTVDLPYLAHYVDMAGNLLRSCSVNTPGDPAAQAGYPSEYAFEFMEKAEWSGEVRNQKSETVQLTVPVMRDTRTGIWYLGDPGRRIAVADFPSLAYGDEVVRLIHRDTNEGWDDEDLLTYANMIKVWDFYAELGWIGPDGTGTPLLLLNNLCLENGDSAENAAYAGMEKGWHCFAYSSGCHFGEALDVMAHEYSHCVTEIAMNSNLYQDDFGAINEAMSDIIGNLCEGIVNSGNAGEWLIGEDSGMVFRSMLNPHAYGQPEYVWDLYYVPHTAAPNDINDRGGVHFNSSILNLIAAKLCQEGGTPLEAARDYWLTVAFGMTPRMDYPQLCELLRWAAEASGNGAYRTRLEQFIEESRMNGTEPPETAAEGRRIVSLTLPESGDITDDHWILIATQLDTEGLAARWRTLTGFFSALWQYVKGDETALNDMIAHKDELLAQMNLTGLDQLIMEAKWDEAENLIRKSLNNTVTQHFTWRPDKGSTATMVVYDRPTLYTLINFDTESMAPAGIAVLIGDRWLDVGSLITAQTDAAVEEIMDRSMDSLVNAVFSLFTQPDDGAAAKRSSAVELPAAGLEEVKLIPAGILAEAAAE